MTEGRQGMLELLELVNGVLGAATGNRGVVLATELVRILADRLGPSWVRGELDKYAAADAALDALEDAKFGVP